MRHQLLSNRGKKRYEILAILLLLMSIVIPIVLFVSSSSIQKVLPIEYETKEFPNWGIKKMNISFLWSQQLTGKGVKIAILDSGVNYNHPDFGQNIHLGYNAIEPDKLPIDDFGHGTMMTGIIAAKHNSIGIRGIAPDADIFPVKVLDKYGYGSLTDVDRGITWCINNKIDIINMSFSLTEDKTTLHQSIKKARDAGIIVVASVMNSYGGNIGYPALYDEVISVTSVDYKFHRGETTPLGEIDFSAPGVDIITTTLDNKYDYVSGTSISAPFISGIIALLIEKDSANKENIYKILMENSSNGITQKKTKDYGWGFVKMIHNGG